MKQLIAITLILLSVTANGQITVEDFERRYDQSILDSAIRYERIKPVLFNLQTAYSLRGKEIEYLENSLRLSELQGEMQKAEFKTQLSIYRQKRTKWITIAGLAGFLIGLTLGL